MSKKRNRDPRFDSSSDIEQALNDLDDLVDSFTSEESEPETAVDRARVDEAIPLVDDQIEDDTEAGPGFGERLKAIFRRERFAALLGVFGTLKRKTRSLAVYLGGSILTLGRKAYGGLRSVGSLFAPKAVEDDTENAASESDAPTAGDFKPLALGKQAETAQAGTVQAAGSQVDYDDEDEDRFRWAGLGIKVAALAGILLLVGGGYYGVKAFFKPAEVAQDNPDATEGNPEETQSGLAVGQPNGVSQAPAAQTDTAPVAEVRPMTTPAWAIAPPPPAEETLAATLAAASPQSGTSAFEPSPAASPATPADKTASETSVETVASETASTNPVVPDGGDPFTIGLSAGDSAPFGGGDIFSAPVSNTADSSAGSDVFSGFGAPAVAAAPLPAGGDPWGAPSLDTTTETPIETSSNFSSAPPAAEDFPNFDLAGPLESDSPAITEESVPAAYGAGPDLFGAAPQGLPSAEPELPAFGVPETAGTTDPFAGLQVTAVTSSAALEPLAMMPEMEPAPAPALVSVVDETPSIPFTSDITPLAGAFPAEPAAAQEPAIQIPDDSFAALSASAASTPVAELAPLAVSPAFSPLASQPEVTPMIPASGGIELLAGPANENFFPAETAPMIPDPVPAVSGSRAAFAAPAAASAPMTMDSFTPPGLVAASAAPAVPASVPVMELPAFAAAPVEPEVPALMDFSAVAPAAAPMAAGSPMPFSVTENELTALDEPTFGRAFQEGINELRGATPPQTPNLRLQRDPALEVAAAPAEGQRAARLFQPGQGNGNEARLMSVPLNPNDPASNQLLDLLPSSGETKFTVGQIVPVSDAPAPSFAAGNGKYRRTRRSETPTEIREGVQANQTRGGSASGARSFRQLFSEEVKNSPAETRQYTVKEGDTYLTICEKEYDTTLLYSALAVHNRQRGATWKPTPGTVIELPPADFLRTNYEEVLSRSRNSGATRRTPQGAARGPLAGAESGIRYVAQEGDTVFKIALDRLRDSNRWQEVLAMNSEKVRNAYEPLPAGTEILLPATAGIALDRR